MSSSSSMPTDTILQLLIAERDKLNRAIEALQGGPTTRRSRSPKAAAGGSAMPSRARKRRRMSAADRRRQSERMKAFWAARRKAKPGK